jgi:Histidine kinase
MKKHIIFKWIGMAIVVIMATMLFYIDRLTTPGQSILKVFSAHIIYTIAIWEINLIFLFAIRKRYPSVEETKQRIASQLIVFPFTIALLVGLGTGFYDFTRFWDKDLVLYDYAFDYGVCLIFAIAVAGIYEGFYLVKQWQATTLESEQLKQEQLQTQLDSLKNQVNPHFLFNSLNSLSSLIEDDGEKAKVFIEELAQVYRYLLQSNEQELTTLGNELNFIEAYSFLLKTRFGEGFNLKISIAEMNKSALIPPLTLQLLVENAVKHNIISVSKPLIVRIFDCYLPLSNEKTGQITEGGMCCLVVSNNLQQKQISTTSNQMGLQNIMTKYKLLGQVDVKVEQTSMDFRVILPLIQVPEKTIA